MHVSLSRKASTCSWYTEFTEQECGVGTAFSRMQDNAQLDFSVFLQHNVMGSDHVGVFVVISEINIWDIREMLSVIKTVLESEGVA